LKKSSKTRCERRWGQSMTEQASFFDKQYVKPATSIEPPAAVETATDTEVIRTGEIEEIAKRYGTGKPRRYFTRAEKPRTAEK